MRLAYQELEGHLRRLIVESRATLGEAKASTENDDERHQDDLLRRLVEANAVETDPAKRLSDDELLSNMFVRIRVRLSCSEDHVVTDSTVLQIFLVAGHGSHITFLDQPNS
jgi:hypothetical protein